MNTTMIPTTPASPSPLGIREMMDRFDPQTPDRSLHWVEGEVSDCNSSASGHTYFTLCDGTAHIPCVLWQSVAQQLPVRIHDGAFASLHCWIQKSPKDGDLELDVRDILLLGRSGPRQQAFESLQARLEAEGLLNPSRKRLLPEKPTCIGIVTSPGGRVIHDIQCVLKRRAPGIATRLAPARVSGEGAAEEIAAALHALSHADTPSVVILARGGGSSAELAAFNTEPVARAIAACRVPVISAVGHETNFTLADLVADVRCATPSEAAEIVVREPGRTADAESEPAFSFQAAGTVFTVRVSPLTHP